MMKSIYPSVLFFLKKGQTKRNGELTVYARISVNSSRVEFSTGHSIAERRWSQARQRAIGSTTGAMILNGYIDNCRLLISRLWQQMLDESDDLSALILCKRLRGYVGQGEAQRTILSVFHDHNSECRELINHGFELGTVKKYETVARLLERFINDKYNKSDLPLYALDRRFIHNFELYLRITRGQCCNTVARYMKAVKKITNMALANGWISENPFEGLRFRTEPTAPAFLTLDELHRIYRHEFDGVLEVVRDAFIMSAFTGLAFSDIYNLRREHIITDNHGNLWLHKARKKTGSMQRLPLLDIPLEIIEKYRNDAKALRRGTLLPVPCNQVMNRYLKEIATLCHINKTITTHVARHSYATVCLSQGVRIENVSKMLGHTNIKTTQLYARVLDSSILEDMQHIRSAMSGK